MSRAITNKEVQVCQHCVCGTSSVDHDTYQIPWKDFKKAGIKRKIGPHTQRPFLVMVMNYTVCNCNDEF